MPKKHEHNRFSSPAANYWGHVSSTLQVYRNVRTNGFGPHHVNLVRVPHEASEHISTEGAVLDALAQERDEVWQNTSQIVRDVNGSHTLKGVLSDPDVYADIIINQAIAIANKLCKIAVNKRCEQSRKSWKDFCRQQLAKSAGALHKWVNKSTAIPSVELFGSKYNHTDPIRAIDSKTLHWARYWQNSAPAAAPILHSLREKALQNSQAIASVNELSHDDIRTFAKRYRSKAKRPDHWSAGEIANLLEVALKAITAGVRVAVSSVTWPLQMLRVIAVELGKAAGGERTIALTPMLYSLWCKTRRPVVQKWQQEHLLESNSARKGSSALKAASFRGLLAEIARAHGHEVGAVLYDFKKFFDTVEPDVLEEALNSTDFPQADCALAMQIHWAPRVVQVSEVCGPPVRIDKSILPGCYYSIPLVDSLMHDGSNEINRICGRGSFESYVDDTAGTAQGTSSHVHKMIVQISAVFSRVFVRKARFQIADKSTIVTSSTKISMNIQKDLSKLGIAVEVSASHRDLGVIFSAGGKRNKSLIRDRTRKALIRNAKVCRVSKFSRSARKLFNTGTFPQATWGH